MAKAEEDKMLGNRSFKVKKSEGDALDKIAEELGIKKGTYVRHFLPETNGGKFVRKRPERKK